MFIASERPDRCGSGSTKPSRADTLHVVVTAAGALPLDVEIPVVAE
jgi:hypothetical protein